MGKRAIAPPNNTATISKVNAPKIALELYTNETPSFKLLKTFSPILVFRIGFFFIKVKIIKERLTKIISGKLILT